MEAMLYLSIYVIMHMAWTLTFWFNMPHYMRLVARVWFLISLAYLLLVALYLWWKP